MSEPIVVLNIADRIATVARNDPDRLKPVTGNEMIAGLLGAFDQEQRNPEVSGMILSPAPTRPFAPATSRRWPTPKACSAKVCWLRWTATSPAFRGYRSRSAISIFTRSRPSMARPWARAQERAAVIAAKPSLVVRVPKQLMHQCRAHGPAGFPGASPPALRR